MKISPEADLYLWNVKEDVFDKASLSWYFASGKFDKNSMSRWVSPMTKLKAQILRASIDNSLIFVPVGETSSTYMDDLVGDFLVISCEGRVFALGVIVKGSFKCPVEYKTTSYNNLIAVHIISTSFTSEIHMPHVEKIETSEALPESLFKLSFCVSENIDLEICESVDLEYERQIFFSHWFLSYIEKLKTIETPVMTLEEERLRRLDCITECFQTKQIVQIPRPREISIAKMMRTHKKYAEIFNRLVK